MGSPRRALIAGLTPLMRHVQETLAGEFLTISAQTLEEAQRQLEEFKPDCVVLAYHFDKMEAFRFIRDVREHPQFAEIPIILVCVLNYNLGTREEELRRAYEDVGIDAFFNLYEEMQQHGAEAALARFRLAVRAAARPTAGPGGTPV